VRSDQRGVAGFFEDLPVLIIVLAGVSILVSSAVVASERISERRAQIDLELLAERMLDRMMTSLRDAQDGTILTSSIGSLNISRCSEGYRSGYAYAVGFVQCYPDTEWLRSETSSGAVLAHATGYASRLFNAAGSGGRIVVVEVSVLVWPFEKG
jgi:hypothetical protein